MMWLLTGISVLVLVAETAWLRGNRAAPAGRRRLRVHWTMVTVSASIIVAVAAYLLWIAVALSTR